MRRPLFFIIFIGISLLASAQKLLHYTSSKFSFELKIDSASNGCSVKSINIKKLSGASLQQIIPEEASWPCTTSQQELFIVEDMNFDGYKDVRLLSVDAAPNMLYSCWLYDARKQKFIRAKALEEITSPAFDAKNKTIISEWRDGCCHRGATTYTFIGGKPVVVLQSDVKEENGKQTFTQKKRIKGTLKTVKQSTEKINQ